VAGVLIAGYWVLNRSNLDLANLYQAGGRYWFAAGWNRRGVRSTVIGAVLAVGGGYSPPGQGPFPEEGLLPALKPL
jgi:nucleobase:cation symporter-1, NCS1 family